MYLDSFAQGTAELLMAVWETSGSVLNSVFVNTNTSMAIKDEGYDVSLVLDRDRTTDYGTLTGYIDGEPFDQAFIDFFRINTHSDKNCLGGMKSSSRIFPTYGSSSEEPNVSDGLYFNGKIDPFRLFNSVEIPVVPTPSPTSVPTRSKSPTLSPAPTTAMPTRTPVIPAVRYTFDHPESQTETLAMATHRRLQTSTAKPHPGAADNGIEFPEDGEMLGASCIRWSLFTTCLDFIDLM